MTQVPLALRSAKPSRLWSKVHRRVDPLVVDEADPHPSQHGAREVQVARDPSKQQKKQSGYRDAERHADEEAFRIGRLAVMGEMQAVEDPGEPRRLRLEVEDETVKAVLEKRPKSDADPNGHGHGHQVEPPGNDTEYGDGPCAVDPYGGPA